MSQTVQGALVDAFLADPTLSGTGPSSPGLVPSGCWSTEVPEEIQALPWVAVEGVREREQWVTKTQCFVYARVRVACFGGQGSVGGPNPAEQVANAVRNAFNLADLSVSGMILIAAVEKDYRWFKSRRRGPDDQRVYEAEMDYEVNVFRTGG